MKQVRSIVARYAGAFAVLCAALILSGCQSEKPFANILGVKGAPKYSYNEVFHLGDLVEVAFAGTAPTDILKEHDERIKEDGTITPPYVGSVVADGKRPGELQKELQEKYDKLFNNLTVTVKAGDRYYYVDGEVNRRGPAPYLGETDLIKAISSAGGFTEFAKKTKIKLIHPNGSTEIVNYNRAIDSPGANPAVYPGDKIFVPRRLF